MEGYFWNVDQFLKMCESIRCFFKFHLVVGVEESIVNALYRLRITDQLFKILRFT
jgi:hypothetical protein